MRRANGKKFLATLPPELHELLRQDAVAIKTKSGGQLSINRAMVVALSQHLRPRMTATQKQAVDTFLSRI
jgi:hypothetical protein